MPKDYVGRSKKTSKKQRYFSMGRLSIKKKFWIAVSVMIIIVPLFMLTFSTLKRHFSGVTTGAPVISASPKNAEADDKGEVQKDTLAQQEEKPQDIHFEFYKILPKAVVETSSVPSTSGSKPSPHSYIVQIASVSNEKQASDLRARLRKKGFSVKISSIQRGDVTWYRIQAGPFFERRTAQRVHDRLQDKDINSIIVAR